MFIGCKSAIWITLSSLVPRLSPLQVYIDMLTSAPSAFLRGSKGHHSQYLHPHGGEPGVKAKQWVTYWSIVLWGNILQTVGFIRGLNFVQHFALCVHLLHSLVTFLHVHVHIHVHKMHNQGRHKRWSWWSPTTFLGAIKRVTQFRLALVYAVALPLPSLVRPHLGGGEGLTNCLCTCCALCSNTYVTYVYIPPPMHSHTR